jgi:aminoglycoside 6-adenylyltransferase
VARDSATFISEVERWAARRPDVRAALLVGSTARTETPADEWSDVDLALFVDDPAPYLGGSEWLAPFGATLLTFVEQTAVGGSRERRVLFADGLEADFAIFAAADLEHLAADSGALETLRRGYRVLHDEIGAEPLLQRGRPVQPQRSSLEELANDVWYHALWAAKKLRRGERWVARSCVDCYLHGRIVELAAVHALALDPRTDTWHGGRFLEQWGRDDVVGELWASLVRGPEDVAGALRRTVALFERLADETAELLGVELDVDRARLRELLDALLRDASASGGAVVRR